MRDGVRRGAALLKGRDLELVMGEALCNWVGCALRLNVPIGRGRKYEALWT